MKWPNPKDITPEKFEKLVKVWFEGCSGNLDSFEATHRKKIKGMDGEYEIDVAIQFQVFKGAKIDVLIECKKYSYPIERSLVQILKDKKESVGAHKAILISTSKFQSGAIDYASKNGVALIQVENGQVLYIQNNLLKTQCKVNEEDEYAGLYYGQNPNDNLAFPLAVSVTRAYTLDGFLNHENT